MKRLMPVALFFLLIACSPRNNTWTLYAPHVERPTGRVGVHFSPGQGGQAHEMNGMLGLDALWYPNPDMRHLEPVRDGRYYLNNFHATDGEQCQPLPRSEWSEYSTWVLDVLDDYPQITAIGLLNEPDIEAPFGLAAYYGCGPSPAEYVSFLANVVPAIRLAHPNVATVLQLAYQSPGWAETFFEAGGATYIDVVGFHHYAYYSDDWGAWGPRDWGQKIDDLSGYGLPIWLTELGLLCDNNCTGHDNAKRELLAEVPGMLDAGAERVFLYHCDPDWRNAQWCAPDWLWERVLSPAHYP